MKTITVAKIGKDRTVNFAVSEAVRYLKRMDGELIVDIRTYDRYDPSRQGLLWIGRDPSLDRRLPDVPDAALDDAVLIDVVSSSGVITGTNNRSVLLAVYRFLTELGCAWVRPGQDGEIIPAWLPESAEIHICERASYRHRAVCIEGAVNYEHVFNMIEWLPRVGMNGYFFQFWIPHEFFKRWYEHKNNPTLPKAEITPDDTLHIYQKLVEDIEERSLLYHATGHGWTSGPFGFSSADWGAVDGQISEALRKPLAMLNGKRDLFHGVPLNTNLCYSSGFVQETVTDAITAYCLEHPGIHYLHFWLADGSNNQCECEDCSKKRPSDFYVDILNRLDEKLTAKKVDAKIVFLVYVDLLWAPETSRLINQDRFTLMFAPITRSYSASFGEIDLGEVPVLPEYERNKLKWPKNVRENVARLNDWQKNFRGDSFDFDYHLMWDHYKDLGYHACAKILFEDMRHLDRIGLNGMVSCQIQRVAFPTALPLFMMAKALWNKNADFDRETERYYRHAFGENGQKARDYLSALSALVDPKFLRGEKPEWNNEAFAASCREALRLILEFRSVIRENLTASANENNNKSWFYLKVHSTYAELYVTALIHKYSGETESCDRVKEQLYSFLHSIEPKVHYAADIFEMYPTVNSILLA